MLPTSPVEHDHSTGDTAPDCSRESQFHRVGIEVLLALRGDLEQLDDIADLYECAARLDTREPPPAGSAGNLIHSAAELASAVSRLGWRFRSQPTISPDGDVQMTLHRDEEDSRQPPPAPG